MSWEICDRGIAARVEGKIYKMAVIWLQDDGTNNRQTEVKMRFSLGVTNMDLVIEHISTKGKARVFEAKLEKLKEFGHLPRRNTAQRILNTELPGRRHNSTSSVSTNYLWNLDYNLKYFL